MDQLEPCSYTALKTATSIRVLHILPGAEDEHLCARLIEVDLDNEPTYAALSYCWGEPKFEHRLFIDQGVLNITENLASALRHLRSEKEEFLIWADAVCINQKDIPERNAQVAQMSRLYSQAKHVHIYLGDANPDDIPGLELAPKFADAEPQRIESKDTGIKLRVTAGDVDAYGIPKGTTTIFTSFLSLCSKPFFTRGWVLQEVVLARDITFHCGAFSIPYSDFLLALSFCLHRVIPIYYQQQEIVRFDQIVAMRQAVAEGEKQNLLRLMIDTRMNETTDPRDKVFALLGIAQDAEAMDIRPDYEMNWLDVYRNVVIRMVETTGNLDVLCIPKPDDSADDNLEHRLGDDKEETNRIPSWVPDWRRNSASEVKTLTGVYPDYAMTYRATGESKACLELDKKDKNLLGLSGHSTDKIAACGATYIFRNDMSNLSFIQIILHSFSVALEVKHLIIDWKHVAGVYKGGKYVTSTEGKDDAFWRTLTAGYAFGPDTDFTKMKKLYRAWDAQTSWFGRLKPWLPHRVFSSLLIFRFFLFQLKALANIFWIPVDIKSGTEFTQYMLCLQRRRLVRTQKGYIGLAPESARVGDKIAVFAGGNLPFVVRKYEDSENWKLLGDCYVHGIMDGEVFTEEKCTTMRFA